MSTVKLEEDLIRRDLTINAMAMDETGQVYDPYGGQKILTRKNPTPCFRCIYRRPLRVLHVLLASLLVMLVMDLKLQKKLYN